MSEGTELNSINIGAYDYTGTTHTCSNVRRNSNKDGGRDYFYILFYLNTKTCEFTANSFISLSLSLHSIPLLISAARAIGRRQRQAQPVASHCRQTRSSAPSQRTRHNARVLVLFLWATSSPSTLFLLFRTCGVPTPSCTGGENPTGSSKILKKN